MRTAVLSLDIEDWHHLDYFRGLACDKDQSLLDGVEVYLGILDRYGIRSSCFVLGELVSGLGDLLADIARRGHDLGVHGWDHTRPLTMTCDEFAADLRRTKDTVENALGAPVIGYRAPCFSLDRHRLDLVEAAGFGYDSSRILFSGHPLYGTLDMQGYQEIRPSVFCRDRFFEFQVSTLPILGRDVPVSGGGYLRIFPWAIMRRMVRSYVSRGELYVLYIHPYELSPGPNPALPRGVPWRSRLRFGLGRRGVAQKLVALIELLRASGYRFATFAQLRQELLASPKSPLSVGEG